jgi:hypothetical protein
VHEERKRERTVTCTFAPATHWLCLSIQMLECYKQGVTRGRIKIYFISHVLVYNLVPWEWVRKTEYGNYCHLGCCDESSPSWRRQKALPNLLPGDTVQQAVADPSWRISRTDTNAVMEVRFC